MLSFSFPRCLRAAFFGLILALPGFGAAKAEVFDPVVYQLDNGLTLVVVENHRAPIVNHMVWYRAGSAEEVEGKSGVAHYLEHLMFKGTETTESGEFSDLIAENGGRENAFTSWDYTGYFQTVAADRLELMMQYEADRMANLQVPDGEFEPEKEVVREERRTRTDNNPGAQLREMANAVSFLHHPYGRPIIGWDHEVEALTLEDAMDFYDTWYAPNNALLVVTGDVDPDEVYELAVKYYGAIPSRAIPQRERVQEPAKHANVTVERRSDQASAPSVTISYHVPVYRTAEGNDAYALQLLEKIMGGGDTSRVYLSLVVEQAVANGAAAGYSATSWDDDLFYFSLAGKPDSIPDELLAALHAEIDKMIAEGITDDQLEEAKQALRGAAIYANDSLSTPGFVIGRGWAAGQTIEDVEAWPERIEAVTVEDVNAVIQRFFVDAYTVTTVLIPEPSA